MKPAIKESKRQNKQRNKKQSTLLAIKTQYRSVFFKKNNEKLKLA